jgi:hypothetical protein
VTLARASELHFASINAKHAKNAKAAKRNLFRGFLGVLGVLRALGADFEMKTTSSPDG